MAKAIDILVDQEFQSEKDTDEIKTTFMLRSLTGLEFLSCTSGGYVDHPRILELGITGWRDFNNSDGSPIEFSRHNIGRIPALILQDLSFRIQTISSMKDDERKNS